MTSRSLSVPAGVCGGVYVSVWSIVPTANWMTGSADKPRMLTHWSLVYSDGSCRLYQDSILSMIFTSYFFKLNFSFLDFWTPFVSRLTPPSPFPFSLLLHTCLPSLPFILPCWPFDQIWISLCTKMSWLSRLNPRGPGTRTGRHAAPTSPCTADPETCLMVFENHWRQVRLSIGLFSLILIVQINSLVQLAIIY